MNTPGTRLRPASLRGTAAEGYIRCFLAALITAVASFAYFLIRSDGFLTVCIDFNTQQLPFGASVWEALHNGGLEQWLWNHDLGCSLVNGYSFYILGSPFYWISLLFPKDWYPYLIGPIYIVKYVTAAMTAYLYLSGFVRREPLGDVPSGRFGFLKGKVDAALIGALLYAFSGFQTVNLMFNHFHDVTAVFPLLLWGIEHIDQKEKRPAFVFAIALNCLINYFFFIQSVVFMVVYFIFRYKGPDFKGFLIRMLHCFACGILGVGMACVLFLPSVLYITGSARSEISLYLSNVSYDGVDLLKILKGFLFPADPMRDQIALSTTNYKSTSCYLPLFGLGFVFAYCKKGKSWLRGLLILLAVVSLSPLLNSSFLLFTAVYQRWWYALVLMMALATAKVLEAPEEYEIGRGTFVYAALCVAFYVFVSLMDQSSTETTAVLHPERFALFLAIGAGGAVLVDLLRRKDLMVRGVILPLTMAVCVLTTLITLHEYRTDTSLTIYRDSYEKAVCYDEISVDDQYRFTTSDNVETLVGNLAGSGMFSSTIEHSSREHQWLMGLYINSIKTQNRDEVPGLLELLGCKYSLTEDADAENIVTSVDCGDTIVYVTESPACPIGYAVEHYILANDLRSLKKAKRGIALLHGAAVYSGDESLVSGTLERLDVSGIDLEADTDELVAAAVDAAVKEFSRDNRGFSCVTDYDAERFVFFSVPYDDGWTASVDGVECEIVNSCGMMLLKVPAGEHAVRFTYETPGLKLGIVISVASLILTVGLALIFGRRKHEKAEAAV